MRTFQSGNNLKSGCLEFVSNSIEITIFSAYITTSEIEELNIKSNISRIIVRWDIEDLCKGSSDLKLYSYCKKNNILLYRNTRIHLKTIWNNQKTVFTGSANITRKGIGSFGEFNFELNSIIDKLSIDDIIYLNQIIQSSQLVDDDLYIEIEKLVNSFEEIKIDYPNLPTQRADKNSFLLSEFPQTHSPEEFLKSYFSREKLNVEEQINFACDFATYELFSGISIAEIKSFVNEKFNNHKVIKEFKTFLLKKESQTLRYGEIVEWIKMITTSTPKPTSWEIKTQCIANNLIRWVCYFDTNFKYSRPHYSELISYNPSN
jgi:hypothetical protein